MTTAQTLSRPEPARASTQDELQMPPALSDALAQFRLTSSFRARTWRRQRMYVEAVQSAPPELQANRIAEVLDELGQTSLLYFRERRH